jgi:hypothetical protein
MTAGERRQLGAIWKRLEASAESSCRRSFANRGVYRDWEMVEDFSRSPPYV